ncbi:MAG TPA: c-type cytochrome [Candidatus Eisenbacteria bacterium]|nr:c-type cytochrome [Candidatus Eisenbacteria bacterium]
MKRIIATMAITLCAVVLTGRASADESDKAPQGKEIFTKYKCQGCHSVDAAQIKRTKPVSATMKHKPPDLSTIGDTRGHEWIEKWLDKMEKVDTRSHPTLKFKGTKDEKEALAAWLETMKTPGGTGAAGAAEQAKDAAKEAKQDAKAADEAAEKAKAAAEEAKEKADTTHAH